MRWLLKTVRPPLFSMAGAFLILAATSTAQGLRLSDVLTTQSATTPANAQVAALSPEEIIAQIRRDIADGRAELAVARIEQLLRDSPRDSPIYAEGQWLRARTLYAMRDYEKASQSATEYLETAPHGEYWVEANALVGHAAALGEQWPSAVEHIGRILQSDLSREVIADRVTTAIRAAGITDLAAAFLYSGDAESARAVLQWADERSGSEATVWRYWLLESLLLEDSAEIEIPPPVGQTRPLYHSIQLRRGLLHELRGNREAAREIYRELQKDADRLPHAEREVLRKRAR